MFGLLVVFILPTFINSVNGIIASSDMGNISTSSVNKIFSANIVDLKYCFGGDTVIDPTGEVHNGFPDDYDYSLLPMDELIKGSETPGIDEVFTKNIAQPRQRGRRIGRVFERRNIWKLYFVFIFLLLSI